MLSREACERRVYRLATLLTGNPVAATRVIEAVVDAQPDLRSLDGAHMDRLTVLRSREIDTAMLADERVRRGIAEVLASLTAQQREAWVFKRVYRLGERETARAMDCSVKATSRHLELADAAMIHSLGQEQRQAAQDLLSFSLALDVPAFFRARQRRRRRLRLILRLAVAIVIIAALAALAWWAVSLAGGTMHAP